MEPRTESAAATLRAAIDGYESRYKLAAASGVEQSSISRFMAGGDIRLAVAAKLMAALGLEVRKKR